MRRSFKFRLYPTRAQEARILLHFAHCRRLYNAMLEQRRLAWRSHRVNIGFFEQSRQLVDVVRELPEYQEIYFQVLRGVAKRLDGAFQGFFRRVRTGQTPGFPRFRGRHRWDSLTYPQAQNGSVRIQGNRVSLSKLVDGVRFVQHRELEGTVKTVTIRKEADRWFVVFTCDGVPPRLKNLLLLQKAYLKVRNQRRYHYHTLARTLVQQNRRIAVEAIQPSRMLDDSSASNRNVHDAAWALFLSILRCKAEEAGTRVVDVDPAYTTQTCSACGTRVPKPLWQRVHTCRCGLVLDRDVNAAKNILAKARLAPSWTAPIGVG